MKKNNLIYLSFILVFASCTKTKTPESLLSRWEKNVKRESVLERKLASGQNRQGQCLKDIFSVDTLKAEVKELEKQYAGAQRVSGRWKHLELSQLPVPQANFLKTFGDKIGDVANPDAIDYSMCEDVPCIYNQIYGKTNHVAGYVHYIWYLKFGHMLSADNLMPDEDYPTSANYVRPIAGVYNGKNIPLADYLYSDEELYGWWRLTHMLKAPHTTLNSMKEIQRIPRKERFPKYPNACGLASTLGWIMLTDGCLWFNYGKSDRGWFYTAITHELSHQVDFQEARGSRGFYRSHKPDYMAFTGMTLNEFVDPATGGLVQKWEISPTGKYVSDYAKTNPQENFADTVAHFRTEGDKSKTSLASDHFNFVSSNYYQNRAFDVDVLIQGWLTEYTAETGNQIFKAVVECHQKPGNTRSTYFKKSDFTSNVVPSVLNCIGANAEEITANLKAKISVSDPDGCNTFTENPGRVKWEPYVKDYLIKAFDKYLMEVQNDKEYLARIQSFYNEISNKDIAREAYLQCYGESGEEACFASEISKRAYEKASALRVPPEKTQELADMYVAYHSFANIQQETMKAYQVIIASNRDMISREAEDVWESCKLIKHDDVEQPTGRYFQPKNGYLISSFYNCLNSQIPESFKIITRSISVDGLSVQHPKEEVILIDEARPVLLGILQGLYEKDREKEFNSAVDFMSQDNGAIRTRVLANFSWIRSTGQLEADCKKAAYELISFGPLYHLKKDLFSNYLDRNVCQNISSSPQYREWVQTSQAAFEQRVSPVIDAKLEQEARVMAQACAQKYPMKNMLVRLVNKYLGEKCIKDSDDWDRLEYEVLKATVNDPAVKKNQISVETIQNHLSKKRYELQQQMAQEYFGR
ncbi:hypothetical protein ACJVC5_10435 [Peredibacter sp. HCB2-198]|uniref:hypothetical protein n=1 Tax=Peredibacter sp. HCB2-198 TaxID=3383025 RepID=UPI0038B5CCDD